MILCFHNRNICTKCLHMKACTAWNVNSLTKKIIRNQSWLHSSQLHISFDQPTKWSSIQNRNYHNEQSIIVYSIWCNHIWDQWVTFIHESSDHDLVNPGMHFSPWTHYLYGFQTFQGIIKAKLCRKRNIFKLVRS